MQTPNTYVRTRWVDNSRYRCRSEEGERAEQNVRLRPT